MGVRILIQNPAHNWDWSTSCEKHGWSHTYIGMNKSIGDSIMLSVNRHAEIMNFNVALQERPPSVENPVSQETILPWHIISLQNVTAGKVVWKIKIL